MHRFKIGQKVVALVSRISSFGFGVIKGRVYEVKALVCCGNCGKPEIKLVEINNTLLTECGLCGHKIIEEFALNQDYFAPLQNNTDAIEYRMKVSIPELITIKEYQEQ